MSCCSICTPEGAEQRRRNPRLCDDCQDWDDLQHVSSCLEKQQKFKPVNPLWFCYKHNPDWPPMRKNGYCELKDLDFYGLKHWQSRRDGCMMCSALSSVLEDQYTSITRQSNNDATATGIQPKVQLAYWKPFVFDPLDHHRINNEAKALEKGMLPWSQNCVLAVCLSTENEDGEKSYAPSVVHLTLKYEKWCHELSEVSFWKRELLDVEQVKSWLHRCTHEHEGKCISNTCDTGEPLPGSFRLIDTLEQCVVRPSHDVEYTALSYVWAAASDSLEKQKLQLEKGNCDAMETPGSLEKDALPEVIADAINLCRQIGQRYLWVDRFCIVQDDPVCKGEQISAMGHIYQRAFLTIVALADGPTKGLPGVDSRPRSTTLKNWSWDLLATMRNPMGSARIPWIEVALARSTWNSRAWTFQERYFSQRRLYFDEGQIYGSCAAEMWHEKPQEESIEDWRMTPYYQEARIDDRPRNLSQPSFDTYSAPLRMYCSRQLTFPTDILHAFAGVGGFIEGNLKTAILHGHPERYFLQSLGWIPYDDSGSKRDVEGLPSWSWTYWAGAVDCRESWTYGNGTFLVAASTAQASMVDFIYSDANKGLRKVTEDARPLRALQQRLQREALKLLLQTAPTWWPIAAADKTDLTDLDSEQLKSLVVQTMDWAEAKGWSATRQLSNDGTPDVKDRFHDVSEDMCASLALKTLAETFQPVSWWPARISEESARQDDDQSIKSFSLKAQETALSHPSSLLFETTCAYLSVTPCGNAQFIIPPRRHFTGCNITTQDGKTMVGISMSMSPRFAYQTFHDPNATEAKVYLVFVIGACVAKRYIQFSDERPVAKWNELCLQVMVGEEDVERGITKRLALGVVYTDVWESIGPQRKTIVLV
ncbi:hypothetical protein G7054_g4890 [Neopestalotiopsis clavispora]|nr:hypothetical protein G7054_g4890 [Neopestalotiopsis clavispora]